MTKLENMLQYVSEHNLFYKNRIKEYGINDPLDITQWPILTRKELQENRYNMFSDGYKNKYYNQQLIRQVSSGSSGMPVNVYWDYNDWHASNMSLWRKRWQWYEIKPNDKSVIFTLNSFGETNKNKPLFSLLSENILSFNISLINSIEEYSEIISLIDGFEPTWLYIQPFVLGKLVLAYKNLGIKPPTSIKYIESVGEILSNNLKSQAINLFQCRIADMYGSEEMNGMALENPAGTMEILKDNIFIEVSSMSGIKTIGEGTAIVTNLNNHAMPLIRYCHNDEILLNNQRTENNKNSTTKVEKIIGRSNNSIKTPNGAEINTFLLSEIVAEANNLLSDIIVEYKYQYKRADNSLYCTLSIRKEFMAWRSSVKENIISIFNKKVKGDINFVLNITNEPLFRLNNLKIKILDIVD